MNFFELPDLPLKEEALKVIYKNEILRVEQIVSTGQTSDWYDQEESELVFLLEGRAELTFTDGRKHRLNKGDFVCIESHEKHRVSFTSENPPCIWLCIFFKREKNF